MRKEEKASEQLPSQEYCHQWVIEQQNHMPPIGDLDVDMNLVLEALKLNQFEKSPFPGTIEPLMSLKCQQNQSITSPTKPSSQNFGLFLRYKRPTTSLPPTKPNDSPLCPGRFISSKNQTPASSQVGSPHSSPLTSHKRSTLFSAISESRLLQSPDMSTTATPISQLHFNRDYLVN